MRTETHNGERQGALDGSPKSLGEGRGGAVERTLSILDVLAGAEEPLKLSEIAHRLDIPKSAAHRLLTTLVEQGWAEQSAESDCYGLTLRMALLSQSQLSRLQIDDIRQAVLDDLARKTRELVRLTGLRQNRLVWIASARGRRSGLVYEPDMAEEIVPFATANGKVWLASLPRETALRIAIDAGLGKTRALGPSAITTIEALNAALDETAARGYGVARGEAEDGVGAVALPVVTPQGLVGTMSVAAPLARLDDARIETLVPLLRRATQNIGLAWKPA